MLLHPKIDVRQCGFTRRILFWKYQNLIHGFISNQEPYFEASHEIVHPTAKPQNPQVIGETLAKSHTQNLDYLGA